MNFFAHQDAARRATRRMIVAFVIATLAVVLAVNAVVALVYVYSATPAKLSFAWRLRAIPDAVFWTTSIAVLLVIAGGTISKVIELAEGGAAVARMVGARLVQSGTRDPDERRLLNVVEEMALASGTPVPQVYVMDDESAINAFAAGYSPNEAVVAVTRGTMISLSRDELQGVIGHEFSHILNGDMRLNIRMIGVLNGLVALGAIGYYMMRLSGESRSREASGLFALGLAILIIGWTGVFCARLIKAAVSRQREYLADASAVQFTRNPDGICGALAKIGEQAGVFGPGGGDAAIRNRHAEALSHMYFSPAVRISALLEGALATHPPLEERIVRINRNFRPEERRARRPAPAPVPSESAAADAALQAFAGAQSARVAAPAGHRRAGDLARDYVAGRTAAGPVMLHTEGAAVTESVGNPTARHVGFARGMLDALPPAVREATGTPAGARAVVYALLLVADPTTRRAQLAQLSAAGDSLGATQAPALADALGEARERLTITVIELALPSLKLLSPAERLRFLESIRALAEADRRLTLHEFAVQIMLGQQLAPASGRPLPIRYKSVQQVLPDARTVLSTIAWAGSADPAAAATAFARGVPHLGGATALDLAPREASTLEALRAALDRLRLLAPLQKSFIIRACSETVLADGSVRLAEAELIRAVAGAIDCPLPPVILSAQVAA